MSAKRMETVEVISQEEIASGIFSMWARTEKIAALAKAGQFVSVFCADGTRLLPRPISLCEIEGETGRIRLVYRIAGAGTEEFASLKAGDLIQMMGPLGNGFSPRPGRALLIGGGIGIPPMVGLGRELKRYNVPVVSVCGYRDERFLTRELRENGELYIATEDGSSGTKGTVLDAIRERQISGDVIYACGPTPMLRALKEYAAKINVPCYLSLEERMACGIGACLGCVCKSHETDEHSKVRNKRVCADGPVFLATEVEF